MEIGIVIFAVIFVATLMIFIMRGFFASSQLEQIIARYPTHDTLIPHYSYLQGGTINGMIFNGTLAISITEDRLYLKTTLPMPRRGPAAIPLLDLIITDKRAHINYTQVKLNGTDWVLGLGSGLIGKIQKFQQGGPGYPPQGVGSPDP